MTSQAVGNLVSDPKLITLKDDFKIVETRIAITKSKDRTLFFDVKFKNNKAGEILLQHAKKGSGVFVWGEIDEETWGDGDNKRSKHVLVADGFRFTGGKNEKSDDSAKPVAPNKKSGPIQHEESDIPF